MYCLVGDPEDRLHNTGGNIKKKVGNTTTSHILIFPRALSVKQHLQEVCKQYGDVVNGNNVTSLYVLMSGTFCVKCRS